MCANDDLATQPPSPANSDDDTKRLKNELYAWFRHLDYKNKGKLVEEVCHHRVCDSVSTKRKVKSTFH
ncbi:hypothetical protein J6590_027257 [Homalodisca vitripennis]|nr:hypothetical protein J6590_027257 [Homalodisca vitripennis]